MPGKTIGELAASITEHTLKIEAYIQSQNLPSPSFATSTPLKHSFPPHIKASQDAVLEATDELRAHVLGPVAYLTYQRVSFSRLCIHALQRGLATIYDGVESPSNLQHRQIVSIRLHR